MNSCLRYLSFCSHFSLSTEFFFWKKNYTQLASFHRVCQVFGSSQTSCSLLDAFCYRKNYNPPMESQRARGAQAKFTLWFWICEFRSTPELCRRWTFQHYKKSFFLLWVGHFIPPLLLLRSLFSLRFSICQSAYLNNFNRFHQLFSVLSVDSDVIVSCWSLRYILGREKREFSMISVFCMRRKNFLHKKFMKFYFSIQIQNLNAMNEIIRNRIDSINLLKHVEFIMLTQLKQPLTSVQTDLFDTLWTGSSNPSRSSWNLKPSRKLFENS